jgi:signal-transduction protein with cAMP-binding, CBS, and nucleotidyltransferase domain
MTDFTEEIPIFKNKPVHQMRTVKDILRSKPEPINIISPDALVIEGLQLLNSVNLSYLIVKDGNDYRGIFSERDYTRNVALKGRSSRDSKISEVMTVDLPVVRLSDTVENCMNQMTIHKTRYLLAYDRNEFAGVITIHDLLRQVIANKEQVFDHAITQALLDNDEGGKIF